MSYARWLVGPKFGALLWLLIAGSACSTLPPFKADLGKRAVAKREVRRTNYRDVKTYYGYVDPQSEPDDIRDGMKTNYVYFWNPSDTLEIGIRMISPGEQGGTPNRKNDFIDSSYVNRGPKSIYFDPWIKLERCLSITEREDAQKICPQWISLGDNDDSKELPANPAGKYYNALARISNNASDPLKVLVHGLYRISYGNSKVGALQGSFVLQVGSTASLQGASLARTQADLLVSDSVKHSQVESVSDKIPDPTATNEEVNDK